MKYLGIDIGIRNLAFCMFEEPEYNENDELIYKDPLFWKDISILDELPICQVVGCIRPSKWKNEVDKTVCGMHKKRAKLLNDLQPLELRNVDDYTPFEIQINLVKTLNQYPELHDVDYIFIENQPKHNIPMKAFASSVFTYFTKAGYVDKENPRIKCISYMSATQKINNIPLIGEKYISTKTDPYKARKDAAIEYCHRYCTKYMPHKLPYFESHRKQDDLSDSYLMCISGIWDIHKRDVHSIQTLEETIDVCNKNNIILTKPNGKNKTHKQLKTEIDKLWIWI